MSSLYKVLVLLWRALVNSFSGPEGLERFNSLLLDNENDAGCDREYADDG
jgi:hypothetical protein